MDASTYVLILVTPINIALNVYFVHHTDLGLYGSPIALACTFSFAFLFLILYTAYSPTHTRNQTWGGFQLHTVLDARSCIAFLKLALPGILMFGSEWCVLAFVTAVTPTTLFPLPPPLFYYPHTPATSVLMRS
jgi:MATE family multidrug resistance protein